MKGPWGRQRYAVERRWECPRCGRAVRTGGQVTAQPCACGSDLPMPVWMRLLEPPAASGRSRPPPSGPEGPMTNA